RSPITTIARPARSTRCSVGCSPSVCSPASRWPTARSDRRNDFPRSLREPVVTTAAPSFFAYRFGLSRRICVAPPLPRGPCRHPGANPQSSRPRRGLRMLGANVFVIIIVVLAIFVLFAGVKTVSQGYNWTVERFGRYTKTLRPGLNLIVPVIDRIGRKINMMEQAIDIPGQDVITKDNATVGVDGLA